METWELNGDKERSKAYAAINVCNYVDDKVVKYLILLRMEILRGYW